VVPSQIFSAPGFSAANTIKLSSSVPFNVLVGVTITVDDIGEKVGVIPADSVVSDIAVPLSLSCSVGTVHPIISKNSTISSTLGKNLVNVVIRLPFTFR
jgi:hypothetical protein